MPTLPGCLAALVSILTLTANAPAADVRLAAPFGDHMLVQRDRPLCVWGAATPGASVEVRVGPRRATATADKTGNWNATLDALPAGGPHTISASSGGAKAEARDVLVGDVWLCSGQSNMQTMLKEIDGGLALADAADKLPGLRLCSVGRGGSPEPRAKADIRWRVATPDAARNFSAVGYSFAATLLADPALKGVPLGVIDCSYGGSTCEAWIPKESLAAFAPSDLRKSMFGVNPGGLYNGMVAPLGRAPIRGVVWYQGESNAERPGTYAKLLEALIASWRARFEEPDLPFIVIELPDYAAGAAGLSWAWLREAQARAVHATPHAALAVGINTNDGFNLHPKQKAELARCAAILALRDVYGRPIVASGPTFQAAKPEGESLRVTFDTGGDGLATRGGDPARGFAVAGADGKYFYAQARIDSDAVVLHSADVKAPETVRYAWAGVPDANLTNRAGLPAAPFRTDRLAPPDVDVQREPAPRHVRTKTYQVTVGGSGTVTSLGVGGKQFLSNALGMAGGTSVPGWLGPRALATVREPGPGQISCSDEQVSLLLVCGPSGMEWSVTNRGKDAITFRVALASQVQLAGQGGPLTLSRGNAILTVTGVDKVRDGDEGKVLELVVDGKSTKRLGLTVGDR